MELEENQAERDVATLVLAPLARLALKDILLSPMSLSGDGSLFLAYSCLTNGKIVLRRSWG